MSADVSCTTRLRFAVDVDDVRPWEFVLVTGSLPELGGWDIQKSFALTQDTERKNRWRGYVDTSSTQIEFRYFVAYKLASEAGERLIIERWECFRNPRNVIIKNEQRGGECRANHVDLFGYYAGSKLVSEGWLQYADESQILLRIHGKALKFFKTVKERKDCRIKVTPLDVRNKQSTAPPMLVGQGVEEEEDEDENSVASTFPSHSTTVVSILSNTNSKFQRQSETGVIFNNNVDYIVFKTHSVAVEFLAFYVEIFSDEGKRIGACYALPSSLSDTFGATQLPFINSSGRPIGQISLEYLFVNTIKVPSPTQTMAVSYCRHWKKRTTIEVGHRGAGNSYTKFATARENTIYSLNMAAKNGADFVEFDVQLTKDKVAIIYHDFHVLVSVTKRASSIMDLSGIALTDRSDDNDRKGTDFHEIAVKDLRLQQLKLLMLDHVEFPHKKGTVKKLVEESDEEDDFKPFPTLVEALGKVDPDVGFNVEVKYPMMQKNGVHECDHYFERNEFVDIIVSDILNKAGDRRIMFSSFDPDICSLIAMKQNRYPVLFLCVGETRRYEPFHDQRSSTSLASVNFAAGADLLGVNFNSEDLLQDPYPVKRANDLGLISFVWGDDLDKKENIHYFKKELAVDGIIYDRIGEDERRRNVFIVEREQKKALFQAPSGTNSPQRSHSPPAPLDSPTSLSSAATSTTSMNSNGSSSSHPPSPMLKSGSGVELIPASNQQLTNSSPRVQISQS